MKLDFKNHLTRMLAFGLLNVVLISCSDKAPGPMEDPTPAVHFVTVNNGSFENGLTSWQAEGVATVSDDGCDGTHALKLSGKATVTQTLTGLDDGTYSLIYYAKNEGGQSDCFIEAEGVMSSPKVSPRAWIKGYVRGVKITGGKCQIRIVNSGEATGTFDGLKLLKSDKDYTFIKGGDMSLLTYVEDHGGKYYDHGTAGDCFKIMKANGVNTVRLRLYNDPGFEGDPISSQLPKGYQDENDILRLAKRAKAEGMQIVLTFHYSDFWTNGEEQNIPHQWKGLDYDGLKKAVHDYTAQFLEKMKAQNTVPEYVALGNEVQAGLLYPFGACENPSQMCGLFNAGSNAVREVAPDSKVIIHLSGAGDRDMYNWFLGLLLDWQVDYDIIGSSYYPFWTGLYSQEVTEWAEYVTTRFNKDLLFMEVGYGWTEKLQDGGTPQISNNLPYTEMTKRAQKDFMLELSHNIKNVENQRVLGYLYWDPIYIDVPGIGWKLGEKNVVTNSTLFDFDGNALEVFDAIKNN